MSETIETVRLVSTNGVALDPSFYGTTSRHLFSLDPGWTSSTEVILFFEDDSCGFECDITSAVYFPGKALRVPISFHAPGNSRDRGFQQNINPESYVRFSGTLVAIAVNHNQPVKIVCQCDVYEPRLQLSTNFVDARPCELGESQSSEFMIHNDSHLPVHWSISREANFLFDPREGTLGHRSTCTVHVRFQPSRLGPFSTSTYLSYAGGAYKQEIRLEGLSFYGSYSSCKNNERSEYDSERGLSAPIVDLDEYLDDISPVPPRRFDWEKEPLFKKKLLTISDERECRTKLTGQQLRKILVNPEKGDLVFGSVYEGQRYDKTIKFANTLNTHVVIEIDSVREFSSGLSVMGSSKQIICPHHVAKFVIQLEPSLSRPDIQIFAVRVNGKLFRTIKFQYDVLPLQLTVHPNTITLDFASDNTDLSVSQTLAVENPCSCPVEFSWSDAPACIAISPAKGRLLSNESAACVFTFTPSPELHFIDTTMYVAFGSHKLPLHVIASCPITACQLSVKSIDLGTVSIGHRTGCRLQIINTGGKMGAVFHLESSDEEVEVIPSKGSVPLGPSGIDLHAYVQTSNIGRFEKIVSFNMRSGRTLTLSITGNATVPDLSLGTAHVFAECVVGSLVDKKVKILNSSDADAWLYCPELPPGWSIPDLPANRLIEAIKKTSTEILFRFSPDTVCEHVKLVELTLPGLSMYRYPLTFESRGLSPPVAILPSRVLQLGTVVVSTVPSQFNFTLSLNDRTSEKALRWAIRIPRQLNGSLEFTPATGCLDAQNPVASIGVSFLPKKPEAIDWLVEIVLNDNETILSLQLVGNVRIPTIHVDKSQVSFGMVPVGQGPAHVHTVHVQNDGFQQQTRVEVHLSSYQSSVMTVSFPNGCIIGLGIDRIPVEIILKAAKPTNIHTMLDISVGGHKAASVTVVAAADSSLLTQPPPARSEDIEIEAACVFLGMEKYTARTFESQLGIFLNRLTNKGFSKTLSSGNKPSSAQKSISRSMILRYLISFGAVFPSSTVSDSDILLQVAKLVIGGCDGETTLFTSFGLDKRKLTDSGLISALLEKIMGAFPYLDALNRGTQSTPQILNNALLELNWIDLSHLIQHVSHQRIAILVMSTVSDRINMIAQRDAVIEFKTVCGRISSKYITHASGASIMKLYDSTKTFSLNAETDKQVMMTHKPRFAGARDDAIVHLDSYRFKLTGIADQIIEPLHSVKFQATLFDIHTESISITNPFPEDANFHISVNNMPGSQAFILAAKELRMHGSSTAQVELKIIGLVLTQSSVSVIKFRNEKIGEFTIDVNVAVLPPLEPTEQMKFECITGLCETKLISVPRVNEKRKSAVQLIREHTSIEPVETNFATLNVDYNSKAFRLDTMGNKVEFSGADNQTIPVTFTPDRVGTYSTTMSLSAPDRSDARLVKLIGIATPKTENIQLSLDTYAYEGITQSIPLAIGNENTYSIRDPIPEALRLELKTGELLIRGYSIKPVTCDTIIDLRNETTKETLTITIHLRVDEPLSQPRLVFTCTARETSNHTLIIPAFPLSRRFTVETDLDEVFGEFEFTTAPDEEFHYPIRIRPASTSKLTGSISLTDIDTGENIWYVLDIIAEPPKNAGDLELKVKAGQSVSAIVELLNPTSTEADFTVCWEGDGLMGEKDFTIPPDGSYKYELTFKSADPVKGSGSVAFYSDQIGDVWYRLQLEAVLEDYLTDLGCITCVFGTSIEIPLHVNNPTGRDANVHVLIDSDQSIDWTVASGGKLTIPAGDIVNLKCMYHPSKLGHNQEYQIALEDKSIGRWIFNFSASVVPPSDEPIHTQSIGCDIGGYSDGHICFRNPFAQRIELRVHSDHSEIAIMLRKPVIAIRPQQTLTIPFTYSPTTMNKTLCLVTCTFEDLNWRYLVEGTPQRPIARTSACDLTWICRQPSEIIHSFVLEGSCLLQLKDKADIRLEFGTPTQKALSTVSAKLLKLEATHDDRISAIVSFHAHFLKPIVAVALLHISVGEANRCRFPIRVESTRPAIDDTIKLHSTLNHPSSISFDLCNVVNDFSTFTAYFEDNKSGKRKAPSVFSVHPATGTMRKQNDSPTRFVVTYHPKEYGRGTASATLIIETDMAFWSFAVKGSLPEYHPPTKTKPHNQS